MRKYSLQEGARGGGAESERRVSNAPVDEPLPEADQDDLRSHRSEDQKAHRRHKMTPRVGFFIIIFFIYNFIIY